MNKLIYLSSIAFFVFASKVYAVEIPACQQSADGSFIFSNSGDEGCAVPADEYRFTLYQVGLCRNFPDFPELPAPTLEQRDGLVEDLFDTGDNIAFPSSQPALVGNPNNCTTLLRSTNGTEVSIINGGQVTGLVGEQDSQPNPDDRYTHVFAVLGINLQFSTNKVFSRVQKVGDHDNPSSVGEKCWTQTNSFKVSEVFESNLPEVQCGSQDSELTNFGLTTQITDCYEPIVQLAGGNLKLGITRCFYQLDSRNNVGIWLTDTNLQKVSATSDSRRIVFVQKLPTSMVGIGQNSSALTLKFSTSEAVGLIPRSDDIDVSDTNLTFATQGNLKFFVDLN